MSKVVLRFIKDGTGWFAQQLTPELAGDRRPSSPYFEVEGQLGSKSLQQEALQRAKEHGLDEPTALHLLDQVNPGTIGI